MGGVTDIVGRSTARGSSPAALCLNVCVNEIKETIRRALWVLEKQNLRDLLHFKSILCVLFK